MFSNCTKSRMFSRECYGDSILPFSIKVMDLQVESKKFAENLAGDIFLDMLRRPSNGRSCKNNIKGSIV